MKPFRFAPFLLGAIACLVVYADSLVSMADDAPMTSAPYGKFITTQAKGSSASIPALEEKELLALKFVEAHDSALASLLQVLKAMKPREYETAINEITKIRKRLEQLQSRDKPLYQVDLEGWKLQSKIDMMMARAVAKEQSLDEKALRELVKQRHENQVRRLRIEQDNLKVREKQIKESLERLQSNESDRLDQQLSALIKKIDAKKPKSKRNDK